MENIEILDSTLRDGAQASGISFTVEDKLKIVRALSEMGIKYIEAGNPGSNPKDLEFFERVRELKLTNSELVAFGSTRKKGIKPEEDANLKSLIGAGTKYVTIFGKAWDFHVTEIIQTSLEENLIMIEETTKYLIENGKKVLFDAEHFFDGYKNNPEYSIEVLKTAEKAGAECIVLCDTNGGMFPSEIYEITKKVKEVIKITIGIHCHDDNGMSVANSIMAIEGGANHVQGTFIGYGERCGNANLSTVIPNLQLKKGYKCILEDKIVGLTYYARQIAEISNVVLKDELPYVGASAFAHKAGMHIDAVSKAPEAFEHINPEKVGNERRFLISEVAGRSVILQKVQKINAELTKDSKEIQEIIDKLKELEHEGYQFEGAEASFEIIVMKQLGMYKKHFDVKKLNIMNEYPSIDETLKSEAVVKISVNNKETIIAAEGNGVVNALDIALRKSLEQFYPKLKEIKLTDYKVRILEPENTTAAKVRVLIEFSDGKNVWTTIGVSNDIIDASKIAFIDSLEYKLMMEESNIFNVVGRFIKKIMRIDN
ncbi:MAG TPA: citramalate synthase [Clostridiales bacterium]|nr:MAG: citramalate synthase [Clostridiales bacterium GWD2_32_59]HAN09667.1 citramalate synthase [Clostridiales bacterium]